MKDKVNVRVLLTGLSLLGVFIAAAVVVVLMLAPRNDAPTFPETSSIDRGPAAHRPGPEQPPLQRGPVLSGDVSHHVNVVREGLHVAISVTGEGRGGLVHLQGHSGSARGPHPASIADRRRIAQVLNNLLSNAARYSPETSPITSTSCGRGSTWRSPLPARAGEGLSICKGIVGRKRRAGAGDPVYPHRSGGGGGRRRACGAAVPI